MKTSNVRLVCRGVQDTRYWCWILVLHRKCVLWQMSGHSRSLGGTSDSTPRGRWHENTKFPMHVDGSEVEYVAEPYVVVLVVAENS